MKCIRFPTSVRLVITSKLIGLDYGRCGDDASYCGLFDRMAFLYDTCCGNRLPCNITGIIRQVINFIFTNNLHRHLNQLTSVSVEHGK